MSGFRNFWSQITRAETPTREQLRTTERELSQIDSEPLPGEAIEQLTRDVVERMRFRHRSARRRPRSLLLLVSLLLALGSMASVGKRILWPQAPARLPTAPLAEAFERLADTQATKSDIQLAMGVLDRNVFKALTTLKELATVDSEVGRTAQKTLDQLHLSLQATLPPEACDVNALVAASTVEGELPGRLAAVQALGICIAAGVTALQAIAAQEDDLRIARDVYANRLVRDIEKAAASAATRPAASGSAPAAPETAPSAR